MSNISFSINSKQQNKKPSRQPRSDSSNKNYVTEFIPGERPEPEPKAKRIPPQPDQLPYNKRLKNLSNIPQLVQTGDASLQFELYGGSNTDESDGSISFGLNVRQPAERRTGAANLGLRMLREDLRMLQDPMGMEEYNKMPVEEFSTALLRGYGWKEGKSIGRNARGYGWKEGKGIGRNAKEEVKVAEVAKKIGAKKIGRGGLGLSGNDDNIDVKIGEGNSRPEEIVKQKEDKGFGVGKEVRIDKGSTRGVKGKDRDVNTDKRDSHLRKKGQEDKSARGMKSSWLRNHIRVRIISKELKKGRLYLKKGVVVDVVGPGVCDISMDESRELLQWVNQDFLEIALPKRGGPVLILYGRNEGVYGNLVERDLENETGMVQDADTHEFLNVKLDQVAEYTGDPSHIGY